VAFLAEQPIDQRGFADVGPADDGDIDGLRVLRGATSRGRATIASRRSPLPFPTAADTPIGSPKPSW
jgi:hypothetical protein